VGAGDFSGAGLSSEEQIQSRHRLKAKAINGSFACRLYLCYGCGSATPENCGTSARSQAYPQTTEKHIHFRVVGAKAVYVSSVF
jgi:hypothetical protein